MLGRIFPKQFDNDYRGLWLGIAIFVAVTAIKALQGVMSMVNTRNTAINADGIPLDSFSLAAQQEVLSMFALLGMWLLVLPLFSIVALVRYRAMIPLLYVVLLTQQLAARLVVYLHTSTGAPTGHAIGYYVNLGILALTTVGFLLSLMERKGLRSARGGPHVEDGVTGRTSLKP
jgi:hypothetical protein